MSIDTSLAEENPSIAFRTILTAWLVAGTLDIISASVYYPLMYKFNVILIYQNIASGVFGAKAFSGGLGMAALGLLFHYFIALSWTVFFFIIYPKMKIMWRNRYMTAIGYGIFVWLVMNLVVVPLSKVQRGPFTVQGVIISAVFLIICIGFPLSSIIGKYYSRRAGFISKS
jgi:hypothetical protein